MNATITLLAYWSIAAGLVGGGIFALKKGFDLVMQGKGKAVSESTIEFFGFKITVGSLGALVMITAFLWGWAATLALPNYKDDDVEINALRQNLQQAQTALTDLQTEHSIDQADFPSLEASLANTKAALEASQSTITAALNERKQKQKELQTLLTQQKARLAELDAAVKAKNTAQIKQQSLAIEQEALQLQNSISTQFQ
jgi:peptidoglycan hydrolase CwlO-like protein